MRPLRFPKSQCLYLSNSGEIPRKASVIRCSFRRHLGAARSALAHTKPIDRTQHHVQTVGDEVFVDKAPDHRQIGLNHALWTLDPSSPGSPFFLPAGAHILQKLIDFLRAQYPAYGFQEVVTPTIFKQSLWKRSGHWDNYKDDMFTVNGKSSIISDSPEKSMEHGNIATSVSHPDQGQESEEYGLKPMNCPGHCILYASAQRSYRELPIRYADFSPLHRDEISGSLSGLTRVRRFHQDDGHIFCRLDQVIEEVDIQMNFVRSVYGVFGLHIHKVVLSTRPSEGSIGDAVEWEQAEKQLREVMMRAQESWARQRENQKDESDNDAHDIQWDDNPGDGAFYGPKIDFVVRDNSMKEYQTATIQLDFQLPRRFELGYQSGTENALHDSTKAIQTATARPVMIHRAIFGSLERFMALVTEHYDGKWPFWLSPRQVKILTVTDAASVKAWAQHVMTELRNTQRNEASDQPKLQSLCRSNFMVDIDDSPTTLQKKIAKAKSSAAHYNVLCVIGPQNVAGGFLDLDISGMRDNSKAWSVISAVCPDSRNLAAKGGGYRKSVGSQSQVRLTVSQFKKVMQTWQEQFQ